MKNIKEALSSAAILLLIGIILLFSGCEQDYYDPARQQGSGSTLFGDSITVPATFSWATTRNIEMRVEIDDNYNGKYYYTVQVFDANPLFNQDATLLGMGVAKSNSAFTSKIVLPDAVSTVYIQQTSPTGGKTIAPVEVTSASLNYAFSTAAVANNVATSLRSTSINDEDTAGDVPFRAASNAYTVPAVITKITQTDGQLKLDLANGPYLIDGNFSGRTNFWNSGEIYVTGTFEVNDKFMIPSGSKLIVLQGGSVHFKQDLHIGANAIFYNNGTADVDKLLQTSNQYATIVNDNNLHVENLEMTQNNSLFTNNGSVIVDDVLKMSNKGQVKNNNTIITKTFTIDNGTFENEGVITVQGNTQATNNTASIINNNSFTTQTLTLQGNAQVVNNCQMTVEDLLNTTDATITIGAEALLTTANLEMNNTRIELGSAAMMNVTIEALFKYNVGGGSDNWNNNGFYGTGANKALLKMGKVVAVSSASRNIIHYQGNLEVMCYDHPVEKIDQWNIIWTQSGITWAGEGGSALNINATECNDGGYSNTPSTPPSNPVFPIIWNGSDITYLFEDNWPLLGDYDMNDVVLNVKPEYLIDPGNMVTQLKLLVTLRAVGGVKNLAVGLQLDGILPNTISSVTRINNAGRDNSVFPAVNTEGLEPGQTYAVIPIFDDVHQALGISSGTMVNTVLAGSTGAIAPAVVTYTIVFSESIDLDKVSIDKINPFIINGGYRNKRDEIHMPGFAPTDKANTSKFGAGDDNSNNKYYTSKANLIWALAIPGTVPYPKEWTSIRLAYPDLEQWAINAGSTANDWYKHAVENLVYIQ